MHYEWHFTMNSIAHWLLTGSGQPAESIQFLWGSHLLPSQLPREHTVVLPHMVNSTWYAIHHHDQPQPHIGRVRCPVIGYESTGPQVVFNVHQSHRHDSNTPAFLLSLLPLIYMWRAAQLGLVTYDTMEQCWKVESSIHVLTRFMIV